MTVDDKIYLFPYIYREMEKKQEHMRYMVFAYPRLEQRTKRNLIALIG